MDVALMLPTVDPQPSKAPQGAGKTAADKSEGEAGFAGLFAGVLADGQPVPADSKQQTADTATPTVIQPLLWGMLPFMPIVAMPGQNAQTPDAPAAAQAVAVAAMPRDRQMPLASGGTQGIPPQLPALAAEIAAGQGRATTSPDQQAAATTPRLTVLSTSPAAADAPALTAGQPATPAPQATAAPVIQATPNAPAPAATPQPATPQQVGPVSIPPQISAAVTAVQQTVIPTTANIPPSATKVADTDAAVNPAATTPTAAIPVSAAGEEATAADDGNAGFAADTAAQAPTTPASTDAPTQAPVFATMLEQRVFAPAEVVRSDAPLIPASADPHDVAGQIVDHARLISRAENTEMVIKLKPEHLGELTLKIVVDSGAVSATFHTSSAEVRGAIEASLPQLRQDMAGQGLKVDYVGVYASLDQFFRNDQHQTPQQPQLPQTNKARGDEAFQEVAAVLAAPTLASAGSGIDYRV